MSVFNNIIFFSSSKTGNLLSSSIISKIKETENSTIKYNNIAGYSSNISEHASDLIPTSNLHETLGKHFSAENILVFIGEVSRVSRIIAPFTENPMKDANIIVIDESENYIIELLKNNVCSSSLFLKLLERLTSSIIVSTVLVDEHTFNLENWLKKFNYEVLNKDELDYFKNKEICLHSDFIITDTPMTNLVFENFGKVGVYIVDPIEKRHLVENFTLENINELLANTFYKHTLFVYPKDFLTYKDIVIGISHNKDTKYNELENAFNDIISNSSIDLSKIATIASCSHSDCNIVANLANNYNIPSNLYQKEFLMNIDDEEIISNNFIDLLKHKNNLCMRTAKMFAINKFIDEISNIDNYNFDVEVDSSINKYLGDFICEKIAYKDITISIYKMHYRIYFNR